MKDNIWSKDLMGPFGALEKAMMLSVSTTLLQIGWLVLAWEYDCKPVPAFLGALGIGVTVLAFYVEWALSNTSGMYYSVHPAAFFMPLGLAAIGLMLWIISDGGTMPISEWLLLLLGIMFGVFFALGTALDLYAEQSSGVSQTNLKRSRSLLFLIVATPLVAAAAGVAGFLLI